MILSIVVPTSRQKNNSSLLIRHSMRYRSDASMELIFMLDKDIAIIDRGINIHINRDFLGKGAQVLRNTGLRISKGKYVMCLDDDDEIVGLDRLVEFLHEFTGDEALVLDVRSKYWLFTQNKYLDQEVSSPEVLRSRGNIIGSTSRVLIPSSFKSRLPGLFDQRFKALQDFDAWFNLLNSNCTFIRIARAGIYVSYKVNLLRGNLSSKVSNVDEAWILLVAKHRVDRGVEIKDRIARAIKFRNISFVKDISIKEMIEMFIPRGQ